MVKVYQIAITTITIRVKKNIFACDLVLVNCRMELNIHFHYPGNNLDLDN